MRGSCRLATALALAGLVTVLAGGCAAGTGGASGGAAGTGRASAAGSNEPGANVAAFDARAKLVAAAWGKAGLAKEWLTGFVLTEPADEPVFPGAKNFATGEQKMAFLSGQFTLAGQLPVKPLTGKVRWPSGKLKGLPAGGLDGFTGAGLGPVSADGRQLHVLVAKSPCDTRSGALVYETPSAVIVGGWTYDPHPTGGCIASLEVESVPQTLARPLGDRVVLSVSDGRPLPPGNF